MYAPTFDSYIVNFISFFFTPHGPLHARTHIHTHAHIAEKSVRPNGVAYLDCRQSITLWEVQTFQSTERTVCIWVEYRRVQLCLTILHIEMDTHTLHLKTFIHYRRASLSTQTDQSHRLASIRQQITRLQSGCLCISNTSATKL